MSQAAHCPRRMPLSPLSAAVSSMRR